MIHLDFIVDPLYVAHYLLINHGPHRFQRGAQGEHVKSIQQSAQKVDPEAFDFLSNQELETLVLRHPTGWADLAKRAESLLHRVVADPSFERILTETRRAAAAAEAEWLHNYERSHEIVFGILGRRIEARLRVFITHPALKQGRYFAGLKAFAWTHREDWPNYTTVYLWHEALHDFFPPGDDGIAVMELVADNELRVALNGGSYPPFEGYPHLAPWKEKWLPAWREYLARPGHEISQFLETVKG